MDTGTNRWRLGERLDPLFDNGDSDNDLILRRNEFLGNSQNGWCHLIEAEG